MDLISVVICTYNRSQSLAETLESLRGQQTRDFDYELLVIDNNSKDDTREVVASYQPTFGGRLRYVFEARQGQSYARNRGMSEAKGQLIAFTDDDVEPEPDWLLQLHDAFPAHQADCVYGKILPKWLAQRPSWLGEYFMHRLALLDRGDTPFVIDSSEQQLFGANFALTRPIGQRVGGFNVELGNRGDRVGGEEDSEFFNRLFAAGGRVVYVPQAVVWHKIPAERMSERYFRRWHHDHGVTAASITTGTGLLGIPFSTMEACARALASYVKSVVRRETQARMAQEMKLRYYGGLFGQKLKIAWRGRRGPRPGSS